MLRNITACPLKRMWWDLAALCTGSKRKPLSDKQNRNNPEIAFIHLGDLKTLNNHQRGAVSACCKQHLATKAGTP